MNPGIPFEWFYAHATLWINEFSQWLDALPLSYAFAAGMLSTVNPCGFIMLPAFAAFYLNADGASTRVPVGQRLWRALVMGSLVTAAFAATFGLVGLVITAGGRVIMQWAGWAGLVVGVLLTAFGLLQLVTRRSLLAGATAGIRVRRSRTTPGVLLFGTGYAVCSLSCTLPVFLVVAGSVFLGNRDFGDSMLRFLQYAAGMGLVFTVITLGMALVRQQTTRVVNVALPYVEAVGNVALVVAGAYIIWYWLVQGALL